MTIIVAGAGKLGRRIAEVVRDKHAITLIDKREDRCRELQERFHVRTVNGDACDPNVLMEAGVDHTDVLVAATGDDEDNLVISMLAKTEFNVKKVIGAVRNSRNQWLYNRDWGVDVGLDSAQIVARIMEEEASLEDIVTLLKLREGEVAVTEVRVAMGSKMIGKRISQVELPARCVIAAILRGTTVLVPSDDLTIEDGDELLFIGQSEVEDQLRGMS
jgi:trk system potassium uptake protein